MKNALLMLLIVTSLAVWGQALALVELEGGPTDWAPTLDRGDRGTMDDDTCIIDYQGMVNGGGNLGTIYYPGGQYSGSMGVFEFESNCEPNPLYAYCFDLSHGLNADPHCVVIFDTPMNPNCPIQVPGMAYMLTWWEDTSALGDDILQLALWKVDNDQTGTPYYCPPGRPNENTVFHTSPAVNGPANTLVTMAMGESDGLPKNVMMHGDILSLTTPGPVINGSVSQLILNVQLTRGAHALALGNTSLGGVKIILSTSEGTLSEDTLMTDEFGHAQAMISNPISEGVMPVTVMACTKGYWPRSIEPCSPDIHSQDLVIAPFRTLVAFDTCVVLEDHFLAAELASFEAYSGDNGVKLVWRTASETNVERWEIERRVSGSEVFDVVGDVPSAGIPTGHEYHYTDDLVEPGIAYDYRLVDVDLTGARTIHEWIRTASFHGTEEPLPEAFYLADNYPNPFNPETRIRFSLVENGYTSLKVYDAVGREVATLANGHYSAGEHAIVFRADDLPSGLYFYKLSAGGSSITKKMVLMK